ncbi:Uncharacterized exonuclease domain-containing protein At3g15140 [Linum perenne]
MLKWEEQTYSSSPAPPPSPISESLISGGGNGYRWKPMCLYYAQGKCNKMQDLDHLQVLNHDWSEEFRVLQLDLERKQPQMFDFLLVFDLEGKVEILEFPVILIDARTMTVVDLFHSFSLLMNYELTSRFVRPCSMSAERIDEYIANKYSKFGVDHGNWDVKTQVPHQCKVSKMQLPPYYNEWINLKDVFHNFYHPEEKAKGMRKMMEHLKMPMSMYDGGLWNAGRWNGRRERGGRRREAVGGERKGRRERGKREIFFISFNFICVLIFIYEYFIIINVDWAG